MTQYNPENLEYQQDLPVMLGSLMKQNRYFIFDSQLEKEEDKKNMEAFHKLPRGWYRITIFLLHCQIILA